VRSRYLQRRFTISGHCPPARAVRRSANREVSCGWPSLSDDERLVEDLSICLSIYLMRERSLSLSSLSAIYQALSPPFHPRPVAAENIEKWASFHTLLTRWRMPALAGPRLALTLASLPALALGFSLRPGPSVPHLPALRHRHELLNMIAPAPQPNKLDQLLNPVRRKVYTLLKPVSAHPARTVHAHACLVGAALRLPGLRSSRDPPQGDCGDVRLHHVPGALGAGPGASWPVQRVRQGEVV
jgi:hypothetical protein